MSELRHRTATLRTAWERVKDHLFFIPILFIVGAAGLAWIANRLDVAKTWHDEPFILPTSVAGARTLLATITGATITVAALVFSITAVTVQLSASQYSPRVLHGFLRDRFQQTVIGIVVGTFTFSLVSLATIGAGVREPTGIAAAWAATIATVLGVASVLAIVAFVDHVSRRVRVDDTILRLAHETAASMEQAFPATNEPDPLTDDLEAPLQHATSIPAGRTGWIQHMDVAELMRRIPTGSVVLIRRAVGDYIAVGDELASFWSAGPDEVPAPVDAVHLAIAIGDTRTIAQDPGFGLRQLTDIALRALSPGVNDPATAADVVRHLSVPLRIALTRPARRRVHRSETGARVLIPDQPDYAHYLSHVFAELRPVAVSQPLVLTAMVETLGSLRAHLGDADLPERLAAIDTQLGLLRARIAHSSLSSHDLVRVDEALRRHGLEGVDCQPAGV